MSNIASFSSSSKLTSFLSEWRWRFLLMLHFNSIQFIVHNTHWDQVVVSTFNTSGKVFLLRFQKEDGQYMDSLLVVSWSEVSKPGKKKNKIQIMPWWLWISNGMFPLLHCIICLINLSFARPLKYLAISWLKEYNAPSEFVRGRVKENSLKYEEMPSFTNETSMAHYEWRYE